jgi:hypothetical protein
MLRSLVEIATQPLFWIVSALGSIILSVTANLITPRVSIALSQLSHARRAKNRARQLSLLLRVTQLAADPNRITQAKLDVLLRLLVACAMMLIGLFPLLVGPIFVSHWRFLALVVILVGGCGFMIGAALCSATLGDALQAIRLAEARGRDLSAFLATQSPTSEQVVFFQRKWDQDNIGLTVDELVKEKK